MKKSRKLAWVVLGVVVTLIAGGIGIFWTPLTDFVFYEDRTAGDPKPLESWLAEKYSTVPMEACGMRVLIRRWDWLPISEVVWCFFDVDGRPVGRQYDPFFLLPGLDPLDQ